MLIHLLAILKTYLNKKYLFRLLLILNGFLITFLIILCLGSTLTADDYQFFYHAMSQSYLGALLHSGSEISGRYSFSIVVITAIKLFGLKALAFLPIVSLLLLAGGAAYAIVNFLQLMKISGRDSKRFAAATAVFAVIGSLITAPSIFDTFVWFSAAPVYILSFAVFFIAIAMTLMDLSLARTRSWSYAAVFMLCLFAAGFLEVIPVELALIGFVSFIVASTFYKKGKLRTYSLVFFVAGIIGGAILRFSPWTSLRIASGTHFTIKQVGLYTLNHLQLIPQYIFSWRVLFSLVIGLLIALYLGKLSSRRSKLLTLLVGTCLIVIPTLIIGFLAASSGLIESSQLGSNRLLYVGTSSIMLGTGLLIYLLWNRFNSRPKVTIFILSLILVVCFGFGVSSLSKVAQAVYVKKSMFQYREAVINNDLNTHRATVRIMPAPILLADSQIVDIGFGSPAVQVWATILHQYYHIPLSTPLSFSAKAPAGYCTSISDSVTYGKQPCRNIVHSADNLQFTTYP